MSKQTQLIVLGKRKRSLLELGHQKKPSDIKKKSDLCSIRVSVHCIFLNNTKTLKYDMYFEKKTHDYIHNKINPNNYHLLTRFG